MNMTWVKNWVKNCIPVQRCEKIYSNVVRKKNTFMNMTCVKNWSLIGKQYI